MTQGNFWNGKKVFVTGHTGFKGGWLSTWLLGLGAEVVGYSLNPNTEPSFFDLCNLAQHMESIISDVRDKENLQSIIENKKPEIIFHLAAQPLVRQSYKDPLDTFSTNIMGTVNLFEAVRMTPSVQVIINITSDKCYRNTEPEKGYIEDDPMGGNDPYSASKGCSELITEAYKRSFFNSSERVVGIGTVRAGNVIGGGDWSQDRIIPDAIKSILGRHPLIIRNPQAVRPWQHVMEPIAGYLKLASYLYTDKEKWGGGWNFGPANNQDIGVEKLADMIFKIWGDGKWTTTGTLNAPKETGILRLDSLKARQLLGWFTHLSIEEAVELTVEWYRTSLSNLNAKDTYNLTLEQIMNYQSKLDFDSETAHIGE